MKALLKQMTFARFLILACLLGSLVLGYTAWARQQRIQEMRAALEPGGEFEDLTRDIQSTSKMYTQLTRERDADGLVAQDNMNSYILRHAADDTTQLGAMSITPKENPRGKGVVDKEYRIQPQEKDHTYSRTAIGNFFYNLESSSARVRVTELQISNAARKVEPHEVPEDRWSLKATITSRSRDDS